MRNFALLNYLKQQENANKITLRNYEEFERYFYGLIFDTFDAQISNNKLTFKNNEQYEICIEQI